MLQYTSFAFLVVAAYAAYVSHMALFAMFVWLFITSVINHHLQTNGIAMIVDRITAHLIFLYLLWYAIAYRFPLTGVTFLYWFASLYTVLCFFCIVCNPKVPYCWNQRSHAIMHILSSCGTIAWLYYWKSLQA